LSLLLYHFSFFIYHLAVLPRIEMFSRFFFNLQPKVIDRADVVGEAGASE